MKKYIIEFIKRGLMAASGGPIVMSVVYLILGKIGVVSSFTPEEVALGIISSAVLAFVVGGISMIFTVDRLPTFTAILIHGLTLYAVYIAVYLVNGWLKSQLISVAVFSAVFLVGYGIIWLIIYLSTKSFAKRLNSRLNTKNE